MSEQDVCLNGHAMENGEKFCRECGSAPRQLEAEEKTTCPKGHELPSTARFCRICGSKVSHPQTDVDGASDEERPPTYGVAPSLDRSKQSWMYPKIEGTVTPQDDTAARCLFGHTGQESDSYCATCGTPSNERPRLFLTPLQVVGGAGWAPTIGSRVTLHLYSDRLNLLTTNGSSLFSSVPLKTLRDLKIKGHSQSRGGGYNRQWVTIDLAADGGWVQLQLERAEQSEIRDRFRMLADEIVAQRASGEAQASQNTESDSDLVSSLKRLVKLRDAGAVNDEEFQIAKERLLGTI
jgi:hypothetical protein